MPPDPSPPTEADLEYLAAWAEGSLAPLARAVLYLLHRDRQHGEPPAASFACPVCNGRGHLPAGFYGVAVGTSAETCRTCDGQGVIIHDPRLDASGGAAGGEGEEAPARCWNCRAPQTGPDGTPVPPEGTWTDDLNAGGEGEEAAGEPLHVRARGEPDEEPPFYPDLHALYERERAAHAETRAEHDRMFNGLAACRDVELEALRAAHQALRAGVQAEIQVLRDQHIAFSTRARLARLLDPPDPDPTTVDTP